MIKFVSAIFILNVLITPAFAGTPEDEQLKTMNKKISQSIDKCVNTTEVKDDDLRSLFMGDAPLTEEIGCFLACVAKNLDLFKDKNMFDQDKINKYLEPITMKLKEQKIQGDIIAKGTKVIEDCLTTQQGGDDACAAAKTYFECLTTNGKKAGLLE